MTDLINGRYRLEEELGRGAMGVVWRAEDVMLGREVAIKELVAIPGIDPAEARDRFLVEARAAARLSHANIVTIYDVLADQDRVLIIMERVAGPTLAKVLRRSGAQPASTVRAVMAQVAQALAAAHEAGVVHRDLKPENVFWTADGRAVVGDFGLARIGAGRGTVDGTVMGTPGYMAPEQVRGASVGPPADVFGWGGVAYELASGTAPFGEPSVTDPGSLAYRIVHEPPLPLDLPGDPDLAEVILRALSKNPADRPRNGSALVSELARTRPRSASSQPPDSPEIEPIHGDAASNDPSPNLDVVAGAYERDDATAVVLDSDEGEEAKGSKKLAIVVTVIAATLLSIVGALAIAGGRSPKDSQVAVAPDRVTTTSPTTVVVTAPATTKPTIPPTTLSPGVLFIDNFSTLRGWILTGGDGVSYNYGDQDYRITIKNSGFIYTSAAPVGTLPLNVRLEVDAGRISGDRAAMGLICRKGVNATSGSFYAAAVSTSGVWGILKYETGRPVIRIAGAQSRAQYSSSVEADSANHLALECTGGDAGMPVHLKLSVNGVLTGEANDLSGLPPGGAGVAVNGIEPNVGQIAFDNFVVTRL